MSYADVETRYSQQRGRGRGDRQSANSRGTSRNRANSVPGPPLTRACRDISHTIRRHRLHDVCSPIVLIGARDNARASTVTDAFSSSRRSVPRSRAHTKRTFRAERFLKQFKTRPYHTRPRLAVSSAYVRRVRQLQGLRDPCVPGARGRPSGGARGM